MTDLVWRRVAARCESNGCVEVSDDGNSVLLRSSLNPGVVLELTREEWEAFRRALVEEALGLPSVADERVLADSAADVAASFAAVGKLVDDLEALQAADKRVLDAAEAWRTQWERFVNENRATYQRAVEALVAAVDARRALGHTAPEPCSCGGTRWVDDEGWQPAHEGERAQWRVPGAGRIPCGFCNEGGWNVPDGHAAPAEGWKADHTPLVGKQSLACGCAGTADCAIDGRECDECRRQATRDCLCGRSVCGGCECGCEDWPKAADEPGCVKHARPADGSGEGQEARA